MLEGFREGVESRLRGEAGCGLHRSQGRHYGVLCLRGGLLGEESRPFGETKSKIMRAYAQSGQYHTIVEIRGS